MKKSQIFLLFVAMLSFGASQSSFGAPEEFPNPSSRFFGSVKNVKGTNGLASGFGFGVAQYEGPGFFLGGYGFTGQLSGANTGAYSYGGVMLGWEKAANPYLSWIFDLLAGGGGGYTTNSGSGAGAGLLLEPTAGIELNMGKRIRAVVDVGYQWLPSATAFGGESFEFRLDFLD